MAIAKVEFWCTTKDGVDHLVHPGDDVTDPEVLKGREDLFHQPEPTKRPPQKAQPQE